MQSRTVSAEALKERKKWFSDWNQYVDYCHIKQVKQFGHHLDEEEDGIIEDEESKEDYEEEEEIKQE